MRSRLWQLFRCSSEASVIRGQLSSSITSRRSWAQGPLPRCLMPSSVISSQWDRLCRNIVVPNTDALLLNCLWKQPWHYAWKCCRSKICLSGKHTLTRTCKRGQWIDNWMSVPSVIWCKSERNIILLSEEKEKTVQPLYTILFIYLHTFF